jgi:hypothetical protein
VSHPGVDPERLRALLSLDGEYPAAFAEALAGRDPLVVRRWVRRWAEHSGRRTVLASLDLADAWRARRSSPPPGAPCLLDVLGAHELVPIERIARLEPDPTWIVYARAVLGPARAPEWRPVRCLGDWWANLSELDRLAREGAARRAFSMLAALWLRRSCGAPRRGVAEFGLDLAGSAEDNRLVSLWVRSTLRTREVLTWVANESAFVTERLRALALAAGQDLQHRRTGCVWLHHAWFAEPRSLDAFKKAVSIEGRVAWTLASLDARVGDDPKQRELAAAAPLPRTPAPRRAAEAK